MNKRTTQSACLTTAIKLQPAEGTAIPITVQSQTTSEEHVMAINQSAFPVQAPSEEARTDVQSKALPTTLPELQPQTANYALADGTWYAQEEAVVGLAHRAKNMPCQDAAQAVCRVRTALVVADGAGSSAVSEIGAQAVVTGIVRLLDTLDKSLAELLDAQVTPEQAEGRSMGLLLVKHAMGLLKDLAAQHRREVRDFRCTLLVVVLGQQRLLWIKVGDGALVIEKMRHNHSTNATPAWESVCSTLGEVGKGEFANVTQFLDAITPQDVQTGLIDSTDISGIAAMSDGAAEKLVSNDGLIVAKRVSALLERLRQDRLRRTELTKMFYEEGFCQETSGDDRSIALAARAVSLPPVLPYPQEIELPEVLNGKPSRRMLTLESRNGRKAKVRR